MNICGLLFQTDVSEFRDRITEWKAILQNAMKWWLLLPHEAPSCELEKGIPPQNICTIRNLSSETYFIRTGYFTDIFWKTTHKYSNL